MKPWITTSFQKSIEDKNKLLKIYLSDRLPKSTGKYMKYRNILSALREKSMQNCFSKFFESDWK